jgi:phosphatidylserine synthase
MKTTFGMTGIADYITLTNALFGTASIFFLILSVEELGSPYSADLRTKFIWASMLCIFLSAIGDIIDGPVARKYSKKRMLGGSLDIMSDSLSFCVAPALMMFIMFGRWGEAAPLWTISLATAGCWIIATGMLRLARFQYEEGSNLPYFHGLSTPGNAMVLMSAAGLIWLQPVMGVGPDLVDHGWCSTSCNKHPYYDFMILPIMFLTGALMISDRRLSKLKGGVDMKLSILQMLLLLIGIVTALVLTGLTDTALASTNLGRTGWLFFGSFLLCIYYVAKPQPAPIEHNASEE